MKRPRRKRNAGAGRHNRRQRNVKKTHITSFVVGEIADDGKRLLENQTIQFDVKNQRQTMICEIG